MVPTEYYLLALSQNRVRLYKVYKQVAERIGSNILPENISKTLWMDNPEKSLQHSGISGKKAGSSNGVIFHGQGDIKDTKKINVQRYINIVDKKVNEVLKDKTKPLILYCDKSAYPIYKKVSEYPILEKKFIPGNPDNLRRKVMVTKVRELFSI